MNVHSDRRTFNLVELMLGVALVAIALGFGMSFWSSWNLRDKVYRCCSAVSSDGKLFASLCAGATVRLWELPSGRQRRGFEIAVDDPPDCLLFSPDGQSLAAGGNKGTVTFWDVSTARERLRFQAHHSHVCCVAFSPDGRILATEG